MPEARLKGGRSAQHSSLAKRRRRGRSWRNSYRSTYRERRLPKKQSRGGVEKKTKEEILREFMELVKKYSEGRL